MNISKYLGIDGEIFYRITGGLYWKLFTNFSPKFTLNNKKSHSTRETRLLINNKALELPLIAILSSNLFWWWYTISSNLRDLNPSDIHNFRISKNITKDKRLTALGKRYVNDLKKSSYMQERNQKQTGLTRSQTFIISKSKNIIDEIDKVLAGHYGFTEEELDFIINYDIKYRMGKELNNGGEE